MPSGRPVGSLVAALLVTASAGCGDDRRTVALIDAALVEPDTVQLSVGSCDGDPEISRLVAGPRQVQVEVTATVRETGDQCADAVELVLDEPLGQRVLIDLTSGGAVPVGGPTG
ncbi:hypothetical protein [Blastococcus tunisiensis]|uniref:Uncharacterized protein n=1 Tax=Blastococcus tunisiensis TaxID=1798228 RepID=A0A1I2K9U5_9ACTN|nr:hypothetical protein [Blastococcus sp. DSM 46838]SFF63193.1 hypothetical protein SAMN05216574_12023 [Blastococcus sp. DSM 46838]